MNDERWRRIEEVFHDAADLAPDQRAQYLSRICAGDDDLRRQVESLLARDDPTEDVVEAAIAQAVDQLPAESRSESQAPLAAGTRLGPFEILALIGKGGMGEVWKARDTRLGRLVAIKCFKVQHAGRFKQEARTVAALNHPHICHIYDVGPDYLVLEYIEGKPVGGQLPIEKALPLLIQIAEALEEAHRRGIIHRDLKPANIMVTENGSVKVLDFGIAKLLTGRDSDATQTIEDAVVGTPAYMSPEQLQGRPVDERSDIFSFGAVFYEMLAGDRAFRGNSMAEVASAVLRDEPPPLNVAVAIERTITRCLAKRSSERFQSMAEVTAALQQLSQTSAARRAGSLRVPVGVTRLIGRELDLVDIRNLLLDSEVRLVNLTGPAGIGKTRLAIAACHELANEFEDLWFVELQRVLAPHRVLSAILYGLDLREEDARSPQTRLVEYLENRSALLVLDNFEQVADAAPLLAQLLESCPRLKILVTSRALLHLRAEHEYTVLPLAIADNLASEQLLEAPAVALFVERASLGKPSSETVRAIAEICVHLDGLPLAIELAAARSKLLSPRAMLTRLRNRFQWLRAGPRDLPERQQTLRNAIDWSYDLLAPNEKTLMQCLSVFLDAATIDAVEAVCAGEDDALELLTALADKSLVVRHEDRNGNIRIGMLETIREYARERLEQEGDAPRIRTRFALYYLDLVEATDNRTTDRSHVQWYDSLEEDHNNCLAALDHFLTQGDPDLALRMALGLWPFWEARGYWTAGRAQLKRVLSETGDTRRDMRRAKALYAAGVLADAQGDYASARQAFEEELAIQRSASNPRALATSINNLGITALRQGDYEAAHAAYLEALQILRMLDSQVSIAQCLNNLGHVAMARGDFSTARSNYQESLAMCQRLGSTRDTAWTLNNLADVAREEYDLAGAAELYSESLGLFREVDDQAGLANCMADLGNLAVLREQYLLAAQLYQESLVIFGDLGDRRGIARVLEGFATMASARRRHENALRLAGTVTAVRKSLGLQPSRGQRARLDAIIAAAGNMADNRARALCEEGERMSLDKALSYALAVAADLIH